jgi:ferredoxin
MAYMITAECISCDACVPECPNDAISQGEDIYVIDAEKCTECVPQHEQQQCVAVCPVDCCVPDPNHQETREQLEEKYKRLHAAA